MDRSHERSMPLTRHDVDDIKDRMRDADRALYARDTDSRRRQSLGDSAVAAGEVAIAALAVGYLSGRTGQVKVGPVPYGLAIGVLAHLYAAFGPERFASHARNIGNGAFAGWLAFSGGGIGIQGRQAAGQPIGPITAGALPPAQQAYASTYAPPVPQQLPPPNYAAANPQTMYAAPNAPVPPPATSLSEAELQGLIAQYNRRSA